MIAGVDYAAARAAFFAPHPDGPQARTGLPDPSPARALRDAIEPIAGVCFWSERANDAYAGLGLDFLSGYVRVRGSALGDADAAVVAAAFGVFEPGLVTAQWQAGQVAALDDVRAARVESSAAVLREVLGTPQDLDVMNADLRRGVEVADLAGRPLFAGLRGWPQPADPHARLWLATSALRELRGDAHLAACGAVGLTGLQANTLTELWTGWEPQSYSASRGWSPEAMDAAAAELTDRGLIADGTLTESGRALRAGIEAATDVAMSPVLDAIGHDVAGHITRLAQWADAVVDAGWFPPDPRKRAAG